MEATFKFVIIGTGNIATTYLTAIKKIGNAEVIGFISRRDHKPPHLSSFPFYKTLDDVEGDFDAVVICTPNGLHHISAIQAANLGKSILCEKPIDINLDKIDMMITASRKNNVVLAVAYQRRFSSDNPIIKNLLDVGALGKVFSVDLSVKNFRDDSYYNSAPYRGGKSIDGGGPFMQQASHYIDLYCWFFGKPAQLISKLGTFVHDLEVEDHGAVICSHSSGMIGTITASTATKPGFPAKMEIYTDKGYVILENDVITSWGIDGLDNPSKVKNDINLHTGSDTAVVNDTRNHEILLQDFISAVQNNHPPLVSAESARIATEMILEIYDHQMK